MEMTKEFKNDLDTKFDDLSNKLVPDCDNCKTIEGELLRAFMKIEYRYYNDGDRFYHNYGTETCGSPASFLVEQCNNKNELKEISSLILSMDNNCPPEFIDGVIEYPMYETRLYLIKKILVDYVTSKLDHLTPNTRNIDMFNTESLWTYEEEEEEDDYNYDDED
jgi:hypothetical protein